MDGYMKEVLRVAVAQICQTIGYNATQTAPLELLQDVLDKFLKEFTRDLRRQVEHYNRTEANLDDVTLTLNSINVNVSELLDYINNVEPVPFAMEMPKFPARKNSCLNFLKPGSKEVLTRPVHVHDHLPPMLPAEISQPSDTAPQPSTSSNSNGGPSGVDIKPNPDNLNVGDQNNANENNVSPGLANPVQNFNKSTLQSLFKSNSNFEDSDRPSTREVSSVVMTTGGYISPAVEGKMPEAIVPDIIDKLMGLDEPPPPTPPPPPRVPTPAPVASRPASRSANSTPIPLTDPVKSEDREKEKILPSASKESKKSLEFNANHPRKTDPNDLMVMGGKKDRVINPMTMPPNLSPTKAAKMSKKKQQMAMAMAHNPALHHLNPNNYANMLLKKAKKQKPGLMQTHPQAQMDKHGTEKNSKLDPAEKTQRKYIKMLQKMAKQGKIPVELLNNIMITDKKTKILNPHILPMLPPGPERMQLEKLLKKHVKQRQKQMKQQMMQEAQKLKKSSMSQQPPPLVPLFAPQPTAAAAGKEMGTAALNLMEGEQKHKIPAEPKNEPTNLSPTKQPFLMTPTTAGVTSGGAQLQHLSPVPPPTKLPDGSVPKTSKSPLIPVESTATVDLEHVGDSLAPPQLTLDGKELKLSNEPDRSKLNIFKKISKQKTPKSSSPTPLRLPSGMTDSPIINLPAGTAITPALGPSSSNVGRNLFPPLPNEATDIINLDDDPLPLNVQAKSLQAPAGATDLTTPMQRVFGEKPLGTTTTQPPPQLPTGTTSAAPVPGEDLANKPKKRGRKPGSKNSPKIPGQLPASLLKKSKKMKMDPKLFNPQMPLPPDLANALAVGAGNLPYDSMAAQLFANTAMNPMEWAQNKQLQQQMMIMAAAKERKEQRKKNKMLKQDLMATAMPSSASTSGSGGAVPTSEEIQNINKKLMRMDTVLKPAPMPTGQPTNDLSVETSLITGKKLPSPSLFPNASAAPNTNTSPLKSPGAAAAASKRLMQGMEAMAAAAAAGMGQPFMLPNRPAFPNLPTNMLSMLPFPFTARPGLIPSGIFPTPGLGTFPNNPKNPLIPGMFPFPNLKQSSTSTASTSSAAGDTGSQGSEDLSMAKKKSSERSYCNVAPLVPAFLIKDSPESSKTSTSEQAHGHGGHDNELPKTPKPRNSSSISSAAAGHEHLLKKATDPHTPDSMTSGVGSAKSIPNTPGGGMSLSSFEQLMKKNESPIDMVTMNKGNKSRLSNSVVPPMQDACLDFSMNKKHTPPGLGGTKKQPPITLNNEPIEVSDDSDETSQPPPTVPAPQLPVSVPKPNLQHQPMPVSSTPTSAPTHFSMDEMFVPNTASSKLPSFSRIGAGTVLHHPDSDLSTKELKKLKKQVKKTSLSITNSLINPEPKTEGVSKLAGGADLIPLSSTGMAYSSKNIPFTSLTANANPTFNTTHNKPGDFNATTTDSAPTQQPSTSSSSLYENVTITAAIPSSATSNPTSQSPPSSSANLFDIHKKRKEHKKIKKELKEGKIKKKKDKKDKSKSKEKAEKYLQTSPSKERLESVMGVGGSSVTGGGNPIKEKDLLKKLKKEKKKEKIRNSTALDDPPPAMAASQTPATVLGDNERKPKTSTSSSSSVNPTAINDVESPAPTVASATTPVSSAIPKLTLKLGNTQSPTPLDDMHKNPNSSTATASATASAPVAPKSPPREPAREPSPELARISPLVTRPPKHKVNPDPTVSSNSAGNTSALDSFGDLNKSNTSSNVSMIVPPPSPWLSGGTISASSVLLPHQLLQTAKHDMAGASSNQTIDSSKSTAAAHASTSSAGDRQSPLTLITETSRPSSYIDAEGNRVWICPACGKVDDGSPMIGCDGCDAWYHWVCVGIIVAPKDNEDWFCRVCITRKKGLHGSDKKRKRNKKK
uniref:PHD-type domain-containing protein n=1 Tax=Musca domestica TaxID=7370 RepID=A0A1I8M4D0_MUSDO